MRMNEGRSHGRLCTTFDFVATRFDDAVKYNVWYGGRAPLNAGKRGVYIGDVARVSWREGWQATADSGDAEDVRWVSGFRSRREAALFLVGAKWERDHPARFWQNHTAVPR